jgi:hypothetical protein
MNGPKKWQCATSLQKSLIAVANFDRKCEEACSIAREMRFQNARLMSEYHQFRFSEQSGNPEISPNAPDISDGFLATLFDFISIEIKIGYTFAYCALDSQQAAKRERNAENAYLA